MGRTTPVAQLASFQLFTRPRATLAICPAKRTWKDIPSSQNHTINFASPDVLVTFLVGPGEETTKFLVHKEAACKHSPVFAAAFNSDFIEGKTQTYRLEDVTVEVFRLLVQWLYSERFNLPTLTLGMADLEEEDEFMCLVELWVLADRLAMPALHEEVLAAFFELMKLMCIIPTRCLHYVWDNTAADSELRELFLDLVSQVMSPDGFEECPNHFPQQMLLDLARYQARKGRKRTEWRKHYPQRPVPAG